MRNRRLDSWQRWARCMRAIWHLVCRAFREHSPCRATKLILSFTVKRSLAANDHTVVSIFVNPAQFAPHEDLATYPSTLPRDLELLSTISLQVKTSENEGALIRTPSAVFLPTISEMYPTGISQNVTEQKGTFVEVKGYGHQMEGKTRPTFFRGVATVVMKLFNAIEVRSETPR